MAPGPAALTLSMVAASRTRCRTVAGRFAETGSGQRWYATTTVHAGTGERATVGVGVARNPHSSWMINLRALKVSSSIGSHGGGPSLHGIFAKRDTTG